MDWLTGIQAAIDHIEAHLLEPLDMEGAAKHANCSAFYFQRLFSIVCGISPGEYIRRRRLTLAGSELSAASAKVIDVALKYGYDSPESFARAFAKFHGITPSEAKQDGSVLRSFSRLSVKLTLSGGNLMDYKITEKAAFTVLEKVETYTTIDAENAAAIPAFWTRAKRDGTVKTLLANASDKRWLFGICYNTAQADSETFEYAIAVPCTEDAPVPEGFRKTTISTRTYAVFPCTGSMPAAIQKLWHTICTEFFPTAAYQPTQEFDIEAYSDGDMNSEAYQSEIWIPVCTQA